MALLISILIDTLAVLVGAYVINGVTIANLETAVIAAIVIGLLNAFIKPLIKILALPITILTLGLFSFVINAALIWFASYLVPGFTVATLFAALLFSIVISLTNAFLSALAK